MAHMQTSKHILDDFAETLKDVVAHRNCKTRRQKH